MAAHIADNDPAFVLADVKAKRQILDEVIRLLNGEDEFAWRTAEVLLRLLALPYAGHPDYREEWTRA